MGMVGLLRGATGVWRWAMQKVRPRFLVCVPTSITRLGALGRVLENGRLIKYSFMVV